MLRQAATGSHGAGAQACRSSVQKRVRSGKDERGKHAGVFSADRFLIRIHFGYLAAEGTGQGFSALLMPQSPPSLSLLKKRALGRIAQLLVGRSWFTRHSPMQSGVLFFRTIRPHIKL